MQLRFFRNSAEKISTRREIPRRIDRLNWPTAEQFKQMKIKDFDDSHQPKEAFASGEWEKYEPFLELAFRDQPKLIERFKKYRNKLVS